MQVAMPTLLPSRPKYAKYSYHKNIYLRKAMSERHSRPNKSLVLPSHRVPAHLARRFHQICLGVIAEILAPEDMTPLLWSVMATVQEAPGSGQKQAADAMGVDAVNFGQMIDVLE